MMNDATLARNFRALAHPRRARLFRLLARNPELGATRGTLLDAAGFSRASFTHHMRVLEESGLVRHRRSGANVSYRLTSGELATALAAAERLRRFTCRPPRAP